MQVCFFCNSAPIISVIEMAPMARQVMMDIIYFLFLLFLNYFLNCLIFVLRYLGLHAVNSDYNYADAEL